MLKFNHNNATHYAENFDISVFKKSTGVNQIQVYIGNRCIFDGIVEDVDIFMQQNFSHIAFNIKDEQKTMIPIIEVPNTVTISDTPMFGPSEPIVEEIVTPKEETNVKKSSEKKRKSGGKKA